MFYILVGMVVMKMVGRSGVESLLVDGQGADAPVKREKDFTRRSELSVRQGAGTAANACKSSRFPASALGLF